MICEIAQCLASGIALTKQIKPINPGVNIIFLTVCDERECAKEALKIKPSGYIVKPAKQERPEAELHHLRYCASCIFRGALGASVQYFYARKSEKIRVK